jgi:hypothetical protein
MSSTRLFRLSGVALLVALPIQVVGWILHPPGEELVDLLDSLQGPAHFVLCVSWVFALLGLPGLYARQAHRAGVLGLVGFVLTVLMAAYHVYLLLFEAVAAPLLAEDPATQAVIAPEGQLEHGGSISDFAVPLILAFPLFGIATLRAGVLPRWAGWLPVASVPIFFLTMAILPSRLPGAVSPIAAQYYLLFLGYAWGGYALWTGNEWARDSAARTTLPQPAA